VINEVEVYLDAPEPVRVGVLRPSYTGGRNLASASFLYDPAFVSNPEAYEISPDLPLRTSRTFTPQNTNMFGAFSDASPDEWGQKIIDANHAVRFKKDPQLPRRLGAFDYLLGVSDHSRMGALRVRASSDTAWLSSDTAVANLHDLEKVIAAARRYDAHEASDEDVAYLAGIATSPGGARPKANVVTDSGTLAIAKLPHSKDGNIDVEAWEAVALSIANDIGIAIPEFFVRRASDDKAVLISQRFDRSASGTRIGYMSAATALGIGSNDDRRVTYEEFADTIAELSANPVEDLHEMFARVALTVLINNTDDHWHNHGFVRNKQGWRLSPVFDVNPNPRHGVLTSRAISDQDDPTDRDIANLVATASAYKLGRQQAINVIQSVVVAIDRWPSVARSFDIPEDQFPIMARAFDEEHLTRARNL